MAALKFLVSHFSSVCHLYIKLKHQSQDGSFSCHVSTLFQFVNLHGSSDVI